MDDYDASQADTPQYAPQLNQREAEQARSATSAAAPVIHEAIRFDGEEALRRSNMSLAWSGLAAGLSMGFSMLAEGVLRSHLPPDAMWATLVSKLGYSVGFLIVILGRQQLFTENTLTPVLPLLARRDAATLLNVLRQWAIVLFTNLLGALAFAAVLGHTDAFASLGDTFSVIGRHAVEGSFSATIIRAIFAGWLIAMVAWLMPAAETARVWIIIFLTWLVGVAGLSHIIAGSIQAMYLVITGQFPWTQYLGSYFLPTLIGNVIGGVALVAALNHAQVIAGERSRQRDSQPPQEPSHRKRESSVAHPGADDPERRRTEPQQPGHTPPSQPRRQ